MPKPFIQCKAKSKQTGDRCRQRVVPGREVCHYHGGKSLRGVAHPSTTHGRYSKSVPARLGHLYQEAMKSAQLLSLRDDLALVDTRIRDLLEGIDAGESGRAWDVLHEVYTGFLAARDNGDGQAMAARLNEIGEIIERGRDERETWDEITTMLTSRRQMIDTEGKNRLRAQKMITAEQALLLVSALVDVINRHVSDRATLAKIHDEVDIIINPIGISE